MKPPTHEELLAFVTRLANLPKDGEELEPDDGRVSDDESLEYDLSNDEAVDTYHALIDEARGLLGDNVIVEALLKDDPAANERRAVAKEIDRES